ncbi:MAG: GspE/PulE family protein [Thermoguttaceae bacterium]
MLQSVSDRLIGEFARLDPADSRFAVDVVDRLLTAARTHRASDLHLQPTSRGLDVQFRIDGVLRRITTFPPEVAPNIVSRLKVLAELLTYQTDLPQEGRIRLSGSDGASGSNGSPGNDGEDRSSEDTGVEMRVSTFPTLHGERAVVRFFGRDGRFERLDDLGLHDDLAMPLSELLGQTSGAILVSGPAGSGKTTTAYACLRELAGRNQGARSLVSIEDPIEVAVDGVAQSQVNPTAGLDLATGLRFLMRQDPEVIMVGEIRDRATAEAALQASLTGHLLLSTFHAGSAAETVGRLSDMGIEPYVLRSGVLAILCQRLVRRLCSCARESDDADDLLGLSVGHAMVPVGCEACGGTGYRGRFLLAEMLVTTRTELGRAILSRSDSAQLEQLAVESGMVTRWDRARRAVEAGETSPAEVRRVLGIGKMGVER